MVLGKLVVIIVGIALVAVAVGAGYILLNKPGPAVQPGSPPTITLTSPANAAIATPVNGKITATFSTPMNPSSITTSTFTVKHGAVSVLGTVTYFGLTATFTPAANLGALTAHAAMITTGAKDTAGRAVASNFAWSFTTGALPDTTRPTVITITPTLGSTGVPVTAKAIATFSEPMDPLTISAVTFTLRQGPSAVAGTVTYAGNTATFSPSINLGAVTAYTATVTSGAKDLAGNALAANVAWGFTTGQIPDVTRPEVVSTSPTVSVALDSNVWANFSEAMNPSTITALTFLVRDGTTPVSGAVAYAGLTATFNPTSDFTGGRTYTAMFTNGAKDVAGNELQGNLAWTFTTAVPTDTSRPLVMSTSPLADAQAVAQDTMVTATFSESMDASSITTSTILLMQGTAPVPGFVSYAGATATFDPTSDLANDAVYTATITTGVRDLAGNALAANHVWTFHVGVVCDCVAPIVTATTPGAEIDVAIGTNIVATFNQQMNASSVSGSTFFLTQGIMPIAGAVSYAGLNATFDPSSDLQANTTYTATVTTGIKDLAGMALAADFTWSFTTRALSGDPCAQLTVDLGSAADFAVLAGSTVTNTGATTVTGDLGVSPGAAVTGFPPGILVGTQHAGDSVAADAIANVTTAYNDAAGRTLCPVDVAGNIGGQTLGPGLYKSTSSLEVSSGDLTLDAQGNADAIFIFQVATTLDVSAGLHVILAGGAKASNIFWQVGTSATLGAGSAFVGTILADQSISFTTGATLEGRAFARIAAVTLDATTITKPSD